MAELLRVENLSAGYGEARVIQGLSFTVQDGQSLALLGRNGVGKTTLIDSLIGVTTRFGGKIALAGDDITALPPHLRARRGIGWTPQERNIFRSLTVEENLTAVEQPGPWTASASMGSFRGLRSGEATWAGNFRAASSRCWRSAGRWSSTRASPARRADRGPRTDHRRRTARRVARARRRGPVDDHRRAEAEEDPALHRPGDRPRPRRHRPCRPERRTHGRPGRARRASDGDEEGRVIGAAPRKGGQVLCRPLQPIRRRYSDSGVP